MEHTTMTSIFKILSLNPGKFEELIELITRTADFFKVIKEVLWNTYGTHYDDKYFQDHLSESAKFEELIDLYAFLQFDGGIVCKIPTRQVKYPYSRTLCNNSILLNFSMECLQKFLPS